MFIDGFNEIWDKYIIDKYRFLTERCKMADGCPQLKKNANLHVKISMLTWIIYSLFLSEVGRDLILIVNNSKTVKIIETSFHKN